MGIKILAPGPLTTIQDLGRIGYQSLGFSTSGVLDRRAARIANILVGNNQSEAVIEMTLMGAAIEITSDCIAAVTGADMGAVVNGEPLLPYQAISLKEKDVISFSFAKSGCRAYAAFSGGLDVPVIMGSKSTNIKCNLGGYEGRALMAGDVVAFCGDVPSLHNMNGRYVRGEESLTEDTYPVRVVPGPQEEYFTTTGIETFYSQRYIVTPDSDRMGSKLDGPPIEYKEKTDIITDGISLGAIQIPSGGKPIIMLADRQTTGGYAKIGTVASVDIPRVVQRKMGEYLRFIKISVGDAQRLYKRQEKELNDLEKRISY